MIDPEVEKVWQEFWVPIVSRPAGDLVFDGPKPVDLEQVKKELYDFRRLIDRASQVYCHVTGNRISNVLTDPGVVCQVADEVQQELIDEEVAAALGLPKL